MVDIGETLERAMLTEYGAVRHPHSSWSRIDPAHVAAFFVQAGTTHELICIGHAMSAKFKVYQATGDSRPFPKFSHPSELLERRTIYDRRGDMDESRLQVLVEEDGDVVLGIVSDHGMMSVEFCTQMAGGGNSPSVRDAVLALAVAIDAENKARPVG